MKTWPRYKIVGDTVVDTWLQKRIMSTYGGTKRDRRKSVKETASHAEHRAHRRVARIRRTILASGGVTRAHADRIARDLDASGVGCWDHWFS